jgi:hypothetical protein
MYTSWFTKAFCAVLQKLFAPFNILKHFAEISVIARILAQEIQSADCFLRCGGGGLGSPTGWAAAPSSAKKCRNMALDHHCKLDKSVDLPQVDHGEGGRGGGSARPERRSREWSTCVACRNLNRIKNFGANNFDILKVRTFH